MLSAYSTRALALLLNALPDLQGLVSEREDYIVINTTSPAGWPFAVDSADEQLTVEFAEYHCHFGNFAEDAVEEDVAAAVSFIQALRRGDLVLAAWYRGEEYTGSYPLSPTVEPEPVVSGKNQSVRIRKWEQ